MNRGRAQATSIRNHSGEIPLHKQHSGLVLENISRHQLSPTSVLLQVVPNLKRRNPRHQRASISRDGKGHSIAFFFPRSHCGTLLGHRNRHQGILLALMGMLALRLTFSVCKWVLLRVAYTALAVVLLSLASTATELGIDRLPLEAF